MDKRYNDRFGPVSAETARKLELSRTEAEGMESRDLRCPICGYKIATVYLDRKGHVSIKCRKCKFDGVINLAYFRRQKRADGGARAEAR